MLHRDDLDPDELAAIEQQFAEMFPGMKVVCAGDHPGALPPELQKQVEAIESAHRDSLVNGTCIDCGSQMPGYDSIDDADWRPAEGWTFFTDRSSGQIQCWQCPGCDAAEAD